MISNVKVQSNHHQRTGQNQPVEINCYLLLEKKYQDQEQREILIVKEFPTIITIHHDVINNSNTGLTLNIYTEKCYVKGIQKEDEELLVEEFFTPSAASQPPFLAWDLHLHLYHRSNVAGYAFTPSHNATHIVIPESFRRSDMVFYTSMLWTLASMVIALYFLLSKKRK